MVQKAVKATKEVKKTTKKIIVTGLKTDVSGNFIIKTKDDALKAVNLGGRLTARIDEIKREELSLLEANLKNVREALNIFQVDNELAEIVNEGWKSDLIERKGSLWIWEDGDLPENIVLEEDVVVVPLSKILKKKFKDPEKRANMIKRLTKRILVPSAIDDAVKQGELKADDISDAFIEFVQTTYVQIKENK